MDVSCNNPTEDLDDISVIDISGNQRPHHLIISGGGLGGFHIYGALKESHKRGLWNIDEIQTIYCVSVGSIISTLIALRLPWEVIDEYLIHRPWGLLFPMDIKKFPEMLKTFGYYGKQSIVDLIAPFFHREDIPLDITISDFCQRVGVELHIYTTEIIQYEYIEQSSQTCPDTPLLDIIYRSCTVPIFFIPQKTDTQIFLDGCLIENYPVLQCMEKYPKEEIMGFRVKYPKIDLQKITTTTNIIEFFLFILSRVVKCNEYSCLKNEIAIEHIISFQEIYYFFFSASGRKQMIQDGVKFISPTEI